MDAGDAEDENDRNHNKTNKPVRLTNPSFDLIKHTVSPQLCLPFNTLRSL